MNRAGIVPLSLIGLCGLALACQTPSMLDGAAKNVAECMVATLKKIPAAENVSYRAPSSSNENVIAIVDYVFRNEDGRHDHLEISIQPQAADGSYPFSDPVTWTQGLSPQSFSELNDELVTNCHAKGYVRFSTRASRKIT